MKTEATYPTRAIRVTPKQCRMLSDIMAEYQHDAKAVETLRVTLKDALANFKGVTGQVIRLNLNEIDVADEAIEERFDKLRSIGLSEEIAEVQAISFKVNNQREALLFI